MIMLAGTFFHQKIDSLFRPKVRLAVMESSSEYVSFFKTMDGKETEYMREESYLLLPVQAVRDNTVYVVEHVTVPYGSYDIITLRAVQTAGESDGKIKITEGLTGSEKVAAVYEDAFYSGMRIVVEEKP